MRLAILSDVHEDYLNLKKVLKKIEAKGFDKLICLGDISGFSEAFYRYKRTRDAASVLRLIKERCDIIIPGNHDMHIAQRIPEHSAIFNFPPDWYGMDLRQKVQLSGSELWLHEDDLDPNYGSGDLEFLRALPEFAILNTPDYNILLSHYAYPNLSGFKKSFYTWEGDFKSHFEFMKENNCELSFTGHSHPRGFYMVSPESFRHYSYRKLQINKVPAIIGIPPVTRHGMRSGFCIFETSSRVMQIKKQF